MAVLRERPYCRFNFLVDLGDGQEGVIAGFQEVGAIEAEVGIIEYRNGNSKENNVQKITGLTKCGNVTLKRGVIGALNLYQWFDQVRNGDEAALRNVTIRLQDEEHTSVVQTWKLFRARIVKFTSGPFNAQSNDVAIEEIVPRLRAPRARVTPAFAAGRSAARTSSSSGAARPLRRKASPRSSSRRSGSRAARCRRTARQAEAPSWPAPNHLVLRRGATGELDLYDWWDRARRGAAPRRRVVTVRLLGADQRSVVMTWRFRNARPVSLAYSPLLAMDAGVLMETIEIAFDDVEMA